MVPELGSALVPRGQDTFFLHENEFTYISPGTRHRFENPGKQAVVLIEVQTGNYLDEDDIVRHEDDFNRGSDDSRVTFRGVEAFSEGSGSSGDRCGVNSRCNGEDS